MKIKSKLIAGVAIGSIALFSTAAPPAFAAGTTSLATVLDLENPAFDNNLDDFDILTAAINAVLDAKPTSAVSVLADGAVELTAFLPTDRAFHRLSKQLGNRFRAREANAFADVAALGIDQVEKVLLYHVVLGSPATLCDVVELPSLTEFTTAEGSKIELFLGLSVVLRDLSALPNPRVILNQADINEGNNQIAHAINRVLLPDLS